MPVVLPNPNLIRSGRPHPPAHRSYPAAATGVPTIGVAPEIHPDVAQYLLFFGTVGDEGDDAHLAVTVGAHPGEHVLDGGTGWATGGVASTLDAAPGGAETPLLNGLA